MASTMSELILITAASDRVRWRLLPDRRRWRVYLVLGLMLDVLFVTVYGGLNEFTAQRDGLSELYLDWELSIPFVPWAIWGYLSIFLLFLLPPFALGPPRLSRLAAEFALVTLIGGVVFLLLPAQLGFVRLEQVDGYQRLYALLYSLDRPHNLVPSLHVAYSALIIGAIMPDSYHWIRWFLLLWLGMICASAVLTHQHHLLDVAAGLALAWLLRSALRHYRRISTERGGFIDAKNIARKVLVDSPDVGVLPVELGCCANIGGGSAHGGS